MTLAVPRTCNITPYPGLASCGGNTGYQFINVLTRTCCSEDIPWQVHLRKTNARYTVVTRPPSGAMLMPAASGG